MKARAVTSWRHSGEHGNELSVYCWWSVESSCQDTTTLISVSCHVDSHRPFNSRLLFNYRVYERVKAPANSAKWDFLSIYRFIFIRSYAKKIISFCFQFFNYLWWRKKMYLCGEVVPLWRKSDVVQSVVLSDDHFFQLIFFYWKLM